MLTENYENNAGEKSDGISSRNIDVTLDGC